VDPLAELPPYRGFFTSIDELLERQLAYLTAVDHPEHEGSSSSSPSAAGVVGVARFVRMAPDVAERAIVVAGSLAAARTRRVSLNEILVRPTAEAL
jgi:hypothetical protein